MNGLSEAKEKVYSAMTDGFQNEVIDLILETPAISYDGKGIVYVVFYICILWQIANLFILAQKDSKSLLVQSVWTSVRIIIVSTMIGALPVGEVIVVKKLYESIPSSSKAKYDKNGQQRLLHRDVFAFLKWQLGSAAESAFGDKSKIQSVEAQNSAQTYSNLRKSVRLLCQDKIETSQYECYKEHSCLGETNVKACYDVVADKLKKAGLSSKCGGIGDVSCYADQITGKVKQWFSVEGIAYSVNYILEIIMVVLTSLMMAVIILIQTLTFLFLTMLCPFLIVDDTKQSIINGIRLFLSFSLIDFLIKMFGFIQFALMAGTMKGIIAGTEAVFESASDDAMAVLLMPILTVQSIGLMIVSMLISIALLVKIPKLAASLFKLSFEELLDLGQTVLSATMAVAGTVAAVATAGIALVKTGAAKATGAASIGRGMSGSGPSNLSRGGGGGMPPTGGGAPPNEGSLFAPASPDSSVGSGYASPSGLENSGTSDSLKTAAAATMTSEAVRNIDKNLSSSQGPKGGLVPKNKKIPLSNSAATGASATKEPIGTIYSKAPRLPGAVSGSPSLGGTTSALAAGAAGAGAIGSTSIPGAAAVGAGAGVSAMSGSGVSGDLNVKEGPKSIFKEPGPKLEVETKSDEQRLKDSRMDTLKDRLKSGSMSAGAAFAAMTKMGMKTMSGTGGIEMVGNMMNDGAIKKDLQVAKDKANESRYSGTRLGDAEYDSTIADLESINSSKTEFNPSEANTEADKQQEELSNLQADIAAEKDPKERAELEKGIKPKTDAAEAAQKDKKAGQFLEDLRGMDNPSDFKKLKKEKGADYFNQESLRNLLDSKKLSPEDISLIKNKSQKFEELGKWRSKIYKKGNSDLVSELTQGKAGFRLQGKMDLMKRVKAGEISPDYALKKLRDLRDKRD